MLFVSYWIKRWPNTSWVWPSNLATTLKHFWTTCNLLCTWHVVPDVVVYLKFHPTIHAWVGWVSEIKYELIAAASGTFTSWRSISLNNKNCKPPWDNMWYVRYINTHSLVHTWRIIFGTNIIMDTEKWTLDWQWLHCNKHQDYHGISPFKTIAAAST